MKKMIAWLMHPPTDGPKSILILRLMTGGVFFWEGLLKFVYANQGVGRFKTRDAVPTTSRQPLSEVLRLSAG